MESKDLKEKPRKISTTMIIFVACVFGLGIGLLSLNYWHATNCNNNRPPDQTEEYINAFNRRLLHAESQVSLLPLQATSPSIFISQSLMNHIAPLAIDT